MEALHEASLTYINEQVVPIVEYVREKLDAAVVITADQGELLSKRSVLAHRFTLDDAVTHIQLVICGEINFLDYSGHIQHTDVIRKLLAERSIDTNRMDGFDFRSN